MGGGFIIWVENKQRGLTGVLGRNPYGFISKKYNIAFKLILRTNLRVFLLALQTI